MSLEYTNYSEELLEQQYDFVKSITRDWTGFWYPPFKHLKEKYCNENPDFDPLLKHYALKNSKMVGFISTAVEEEKEGVQYATLQVPFIEDSDLEVEDMLMEEAIQALIRNDAQVINTYLMDNWEVPQGFADRYDFKKTGDVIAKVARVPFRNYDVSTYKRPDYIVDVDPVVDKEGLVEVFKDEMEQTPEKIAKTIDSWKEEKVKKKIVTNVIVKDDEGIIAHAMIVAKNNKMGNMAHISVYREGHEHLRKEIFDLMMQKLQETEIEKVLLYLYQPSFHAMPDYETYGLIFDNMQRYCINFLEDDIKDSYVPMEANRLHIMR